MACINLCINYLCANCVFQLYSHIRYYRKDVKFARLGIKFCARRRHVIMYREVSIARAVAVAAKLVSRGR